MLGNNKCNGETESRRRYAGGVGRGDNGTDEEGGKQNNGPP